MRSARCTHRPGTCMSPASCTALRRKHQPPGQCSLRTTGALPATQRPLQALQGVLYFFFCFVLSEIGKSNPARAGGRGADDSAVRRVLATSMMPDTRRASELGLCNLGRGPA
jgi:hypothetical protein